MELFFLQSLLFFFLFFTYLYLHFKSSQRKPKNKGFKAYPIVGSLPDFLIHRHRFLEWVTEVLSRCPTNTSIFHRPGVVHGIMTANPMNVEHMLKTNFENYPKGERFIALLEDFLGKGIFNADGELWKVQRKTASYEFNTKSLRNFVIENVTAEIKMRLVPGLIKACETNQVVNFQDILERFAFDNICKVAFNVDSKCLVNDQTIGGEFMRAFDDAANLSAGRFLYALPNMYKIKKYLNIGSEHRLKQSITTVHEFADNIIQSRINNKVSKNNKGEGEGEDLLSRFMETHENSEFLRDIVISFILAGRDTTSSGLSWFFWLLSSNPDVKQKILNELETIRARSGKSIDDVYDFNELRDMHYLHAAISETLRLYPPVPVDTKECLEDDVMPDGTFVGKGWFISYNTYAMGRMESVWGKNCREFVPERWLDDNGMYKVENPFKFPVFHAGPRICLGKDMAYIQMKSIAASVIERFEVEVLEKDKCPEHLLSLTLRMKGGLPVRVKERCVGMYALY